jgi:hypothetical protein
VANPAGSDQLAIGSIFAGCWLTGDATGAIKPGRGIIDCAGSCGTAGQVLTSTGANRVLWQPGTQTYTRTKNLTGGLNYTMAQISGVRSGIFYAAAIDSTGNTSAQAQFNIVGTASAGNVASITVTPVGAGSTGLWSITNSGGFSIVRFNPTASVTNLTLNFTWIGTGTITVYS